ncbi:MAG: hypothetical protein WCR07_10345 [Verrucomicrobiota bacterium]|jgi:hypothetical protein
MNETDGMNRDEAAQWIAEAHECAHCKDASLDRVSRVLFWLLLKGGLHVRLNPKWSDLCQGPMETAVETLVGRMLWMLQMEQVKRLDAAKVGDPLKLADQLEQAGIRIRSEVRSWRHDAKNLMERAQSAGISCDLAFGQGQTVSAIADIREGLLAMRHQLLQRMAVARSASSGGPPEAGACDELVSLLHRSERLLRQDRDLWRQFLCEASATLRLEQYICFWRAPS